MNRLKDIFKKVYTHPLASHLNIDSKEAVGVHKRIIKENSLLFRHYTFIYRHFKVAEESLPGMEGMFSLEIGSGGGFLKEFLPGVITSDIVLSEGIDRIESADSLTFRDESLKAIYANGVLHHIKYPARCLSEIQRVLAPGGLFVCNEPSSTPFGYFMNKHFHDEFTDKGAKDWNLEDKEGGRLTEANMALPYIIFRRDAAIFKERFKRLRVCSIIYHDFIRYTLSGGLSYRPFIPAFLFWLVNAGEVILRPLMPIIGNNMLITIQKI